MLAHSGTCCFFVSQSSAFEKHQPVVEQRGAEEPHLWVSGGFCWVLLSSLDVPRESFVSLDLGETTKPRTINIALDHDLYGEIHSVLVV